MTLLRRRDDVTRFFSSYVLLMSIHLHFQCFNEKCVQMLVNRRTRLFNDPNTLDSPSSIILNHIFLTNKYTEDLYVHY